MFAVLVVKKENKKNTVEKKRNDKLLEMNYSLTTFRVEINHRKTTDPEFPKQNLAIQEMNELQLLSNEYHRVSGKYRVKFPCNCLPLIYFRAFNRATQMPQF